MYDAIPLMYYANVLMYDAIPLMYYANVLMYDAIFLVCEVITILLCLDLYFAMLKS